MSGQSAPRQENGLLTIAGARFGLLKAGRRVP